MKFRIISIGKIKNKLLSGEINELKKRISRLELITINDVKERNIDLIKKKEEKLILSKLNDNDLNILLWEFGKEFTTNDLYLKFKNELRTITFIITGPFGPSENLKKKLFKLSLSKFTFTHEQALYLLMEQIYRIESIRKNIPYNK